jgi:cysteine desulfurase
MAAMLPFFMERFHNSSSIAGEVSGLRRAVAQARRHIAGLLSLDDPDECIFTSGATEANNSAVFGVGELCQPGHAITTELEHPSVLQSVHRLRTRDWTVTVLPPNTRGIVTADAVLAALRPDTRLLSVMMASNETGIIQPVAEIAAAVKATAPAVFIHSDLTQAVGKIPVCLGRQFEAIDLASLSCHKFHGPKGCGALIIRGGLKLIPLLVGGEQEGGRRSGTLNVPAIVGGGAAAEESHEHLSSASRVAMLRDRFEETLCHEFPSAVVFGRGESRLPNTSCFAIPGQNANALADRLALRGIFVGTGSACSSGALHPPRTLLAMGVAHELAAAALRVSLSRFSVEEDCGRLIAELRVACNGVEALGAFVLPDLK